MVTKKLNQKTINKIANVGGCSNFGGLVVVGSKMYTIKTKAGNTLSYISQYPHYTKSTRKNHKFANCMGHGNDMCYYNGNLYVVPLGRFVEKVSVKTWKHKRIPSDVYISAMAHYKDNQFIVLCGTNSTANTYKLAIIEEKADKFILIKSWTVNKPADRKDYVHSQGMTYYPKSDRIYVIFTKTGNKTGIILRSAVGEASPDYCFTSKVSKSKYQMEGLCFNSKGKKIIGANIAGGDVIFKS